MTPTAIAMHSPVTAKSEKYYHQRHRLFSRFDFGCQLDEEGWWSVTPEAIAKHTAQRVQSACYPSTPVVVDAFCGCGGNAIQFALAGCHVIAVEVHAARLSMAQHNAQVYGVKSQIEFVRADFFHILPSLQQRQQTAASDQMWILFLSPPWGGPDYLAMEHYHLSSLRPMAGHDLMDRARQLTRDVILYLPRTTDLQDVIQLTEATGDPVEVEQNILDGKLKTISIYFGRLARPVHTARTE